MSRVVSLVFVLSGCTSSAPSEEQTTDTGSGVAPVENPFGSVNGCGTFETGTVTIKAGGFDRTLQVELPADPQGAPVVFAWHWLGGNATEILTWMEM